MNCSKHGDKESVAKCIECGRAMCEQCAQEGEKLIPKRRMCADCCKKVLQEERKEAKSDTIKMSLIAIGFAALYAIGAVVFAAGIMASQNDDSFIKVILMCIAGLVLAGLPFALGGRSIAEERREAYKRENGADYRLNIDDNGRIDIVEDKTRDDKAKIIGFILGVVSGVVVTPIAVIVCIVVAIKNGAVIRKIDARLSAASAGAASSATISGASKNI